MMSIRIVRAYATFCYLIILLLKPSCVGGLQWLTMASVGTFSPSQRMTREVCKSYGLTKRQVHICRENVQHMISVQLGARMAIHECQHQFRHRRWNCTYIDAVNVFGNVLKAGTREAAFVHAISSAGVAHMVTADCSDGKLSNCGCDMSVNLSPNEDFQWSGCSDNVRYGALFSKRFVDAQERRKRQSYARYLMNLHNNEAGRQVIEQNLRTQCKCHGVSGSCELRTCWKKLPAFRDVGQLLKDKFDGATEVQLLKEQTVKSLQPVDTRFKRQTKSDLVYLESSPDYCEHDNMTGTLGTNGRRCEADSQALNGCSLLCCNRSYNTRVEQRVERCNCRFQWCCEVKCQECIKTETVYTCL